MSDKFDDYGLEEAQEQRDMDIAEAKEISDKLYMDNIERMRSTMADKLHEKVNTNPEVLLEETRNKRDELQKKLADENDT
jgi:hypothetical protein